MTEFQEHLDALKALYHKLEEERYGRVDIEPHPVHFVDLETAKPALNSRAGAFSASSTGRQPSVFPTELQLQEVCSEGGMIPPTVQEVPRGDGGSPDPGISAQQAEEMQLSSSMRRLKRRFTTLVPEFVMGKQSTEGCDTKAAIFERTLLEKVAVEPSDCGVLSPVSGVRLAWDVFLAIIVAFELWSLPVIAVFYNDTDYPSSLDSMVLVATLSCALDILLNFNTGYIDRNHRLVMRRHQICWKYLKFWFWLDLVATIPYDHIHSQIAGSSTKWVRCSRAFKALKHVRYFSLLRTVRVIHRGLLAPRAQEYLWEWLQMLGVVKRFSVGLKALLVLCVSSHVFGCAWALARRIDGDFSDEAPLRKYYESFWWAFVNIAGGVLGAPSWVSGPSVWTMDLVIVCVRLALLVVGVRACVTSALTDDTSQSCMKQRALAYFRKHKVRLAAQVKVMQCINETGQVNRMQQAFHELMSNEMPPTVRGMVLEELWVERLISFQLFRPLYEWAPDAIRDLAQHVSEEVLGSHVILFREGDKSTAAFRILSGSIRLSTMSHKRFPDFTEGMWIGETSLLNPLLLRSASAVSQDLTTLMVVPAGAFQKSLVKWGLDRRFHVYCKRHIWKGLCARCGSLGKHWPDQCPTIQREDGHHPPSTLVRHVTTRMTTLASPRSPPAAPFSGESTLPHEDEGAAELKKFLECQDMAFLIPQLNAQGIFTLSDLRASDLHSLNDFFSGTLRGVELDIFEKHAFAEETFGDFYEEAAASVSELLFFGMERSQHFLFLSHYKAEAGTEAALIFSEIEGLLAGSSDHAGNRFDVPVFLDTENLRNLDKLRQHVRQSHNLVILLTENILTRPWCLVEIATAVQERVALVPVLVEKPGQKPFVFPSDAFYHKLASGKLLNADCMKVLQDSGVGLADLCRDIQEVFKIIALRYAPHEATASRRQMAQAILDNCKITKHAK